MNKKREKSAKSETPEQRVSRLMKANKSKGTKPELLLRKALWQAGKRGYRLHSKEVPGRPDVSFSKNKLAVFVHGCYWHQCPRCEGKKAYPRSNKAFWDKKFAENAARDARVQVSLRESGWQSLVFWECEVRPDAEGCAQRVSLALSGERPAAIPTFGTLL